MQMEKKSFNLDPNLQIFLSIVHNLNFKDILIDIIGSQWIAPKQKDEFSRALFILYLYRLKEEDVIYRGLPSSYIDVVFFF